MKYRLTDETTTHNGITLYRIQALKDFSNVKTGDLGGWVESERNLSQDDNPLVFDDAWIGGDAKVFGNAFVSGNARVFGKAQVFDNAWVFGIARVGDNARVYGNTWVSDNAQVYGNAVIIDGCIG